MYERQPNVALTVLSFVIFLTGVVLAVGTDGTTQRIGYLLWGLVEPRRWLPARRARQR